VGATIFATVTIAAGSALIGYGIIARLIGLHRPMRWQGGDQISLVGELAIGVFALSAGLAVGTNSGLWVIPCVLAAVVGIVSQGRAKRRHAVAEQRLRERNAKSYPGIFDQEPPDDIHATGDFEFHVFDAGVCTYLGKASRQDLEILIDCFRDMPEQRPNDIFLMPESLGLVPEGSLSQEFLMLLEQGFKHRDFLMVRWMPPSQCGKAVNDLASR
jgi:hypothetical protein